MDQQDDVELVIMYTAHRKGIFNMPVLNYGFYLALQPLLGVAKISQENQSQYSSSFPLPF